MIKKLLIVTSTSNRSHNSGVAFNYISSSIKNSDFDSFVCDKEKYCDCTGCMYCIKSGVCVKKDRVSLLLKKDYTDFLFICPAYFFGIKSDISRFIDRLYSCSLTGVNFHFLIFTGSSGIDSGIDCIKNRFNYIDRYCGTNTSIYQVVTHDCLLDISDYIDSISHVIEEVKP